MALIKLESACLAYGHVPLLDKVDLQIDAGERVCLVGRNGAGKSTLMRVMEGAAELDEGGLWKKPDLRVGILAQEVPQLDELTVYDVVAGGLDHIGEVIAEYHHVLHEMETNFSDAINNKLARLQDEIDSNDGWNLEQRITTVITKLELPEDALMGSLSGGYKRRVMLARALVLDPELILLDEPTNHLDVEAIQWMEDFLLGFNGAVLFITHDRTFLRHLATRIVELDRGKITSWPGNYDTYIKNKEERAVIEEQQNALFDKKLAQEEVWIRQGIKARRTRNEGRVRALEQLRRERSSRLNKVGNVNLQVESGEASGKIVIEVEGISKSFADKTIVKSLSTKIMRGDRIGILGPNGVGKSTLLKMLLGELEPDTGTVSLGTKLSVAYFDQQRAVLDLEKTVADNLNFGSDTITINGRSRHVMSYLQDFLFPPARVRSPVKSLSGGERNRLLLARLFIQPANLLVLDEPTNDLDVETLELLEELLCNYDGTLILVSHDRTFLDNVVTSTLAFEGDGQVNEYVGGYEDWLRQSRQVDTSTTARKTGKKEAKQEKKKSKLSYKDQFELDTLPQNIEKLETEQEQIQNKIAEPGFYQQEKKDIDKVLTRLSELKKELETTYARWEELSD
ncbi:MAG: ATP-binding cassette domain-containing protein [Gammaproteobacteria bacterium]|nr:ATP-binding cassette domain-containing protein [Gammaproteobacteria bacterium]